MSHRAINVHHLDRLETSFNKPKSSKCATGSGKITFGKFLKEADLDDMQPGYNTIPAQHIPRSGIPVTMVEREKLSGLGIYA